MIPGLVGISCENCLIERGLTERRPTEVLNIAWLRRWQ